MEYRDLVRDFAKRTMRNLEAIEDNKSNQIDSGVFEVTQLINSMLGLLVFPQQKYFDSIPEIELHVLAEDGWPTPKVRGNFPETRDLRELTRYMRNAFAHFHVKFLSKNGQISGIILWNIRHGRKNWEIELDLHELRVITYKFIDLIINK